MILRRADNSGGKVVVALINDQYYEIENSKLMSDFISQHELCSKFHYNLLEIANLEGELLSELEAIILADAKTYNAPLDDIIPIEPKSFRDFMLFEKHVIDSTRGYVRRFLPTLFHLTNTIEKITGKTFAKFRPHKLWYQQPIYYFGNHLNFGGSGNNVVTPEYTNALDYELEIGAILSRPLRDATPEEAKAAIGGYVILNDLSARDVQKDEMECGFGPQKAKHFHSTMSSELLTSRDLNFEADEFTASVLINGKVVSKCNTVDMKYTFAEAISFASKSEQLHVGELFGSGTLPGGSGMETGNWVTSGDVLTLKVDQIGELSNTIV